MSEAYPSIEGSIPVFQRPVITLPNTQITAVVSREENAYMVVYLGTSSGFLKKVFVGLSGSDPYYAYHKYNRL